MEKQRNRLHMKEQDNSLEKIDEMEASNLSDKKFRVMVIRILNSMKSHRNHKKEPVRNNECNI